MEWTIYYRPKGVNFENEYDTFFGTQKEVSEYVKKLNSKKDGYVYRFG